MKLSSRLLLVIASILILSVIWLPFWRIELDAPQYPEGLMLKIWCNKLTGDVDIINGLNHYIGMRTLHANDFVEFSVLRYIVAGISLLTLLAAAINRKKVLYFLFGFFLLFAILCLVDFWRWEYDYGHNLNPEAPIQVPGMAYQPPLIGFKQLLNFGAFSIPDTGGWLFATAGLLMAIAVYFEIKFKPKS